jgi:hypothetical protein
MKAIITLEQYLRIKEVGRARAAIPSDKELARELGVGIHAVQRVLHRPMKCHEKVLRGHPT